MTELQKDIEFIMDYFDFSRVHKAMKALDWKWFLNDNNDGIPNEPDLRKESRRLLNLAWEYGMRAKADWSVGTGGFTAIFHWNNGKPILQLTFTVEEVCS